MNREQLLDLVNHGREIEFRFGGKYYSITYGTLNGRHVISFCEFNKETTEVETPEAVLNVTRDNVSVLDMIESLTEDDIWIY